MALDFIANLSKRGNGNLWRRLIPISQGPKILFTSEFHFVAMRMLSRKAAFMVLSFAVGSFSWIM